MVLSLEDVFHKVGADKSGATASEALHRALASALRLMPAYAARRPV